MYLNSAIQNRIFRLISLSSSEIQQDSYVIGGSVRDVLLKNRLPKYIDIVTVGSGVLLAQKVSKHLNISYKITCFKNFGTAILKYSNHEIEFIGARKESYRNDSRQPIGSITDDQKRRSFTINAMAISLNTFNYGKLIDPFDGLYDLHSHPRNPWVTSSDDPLRMLRAIRFSSQLDFLIEEQAICLPKNRIHIVSIERIMEEFNNIMLSRQPSVGLKLLHKSGLLSKILPELTDLEGVEEKEGHYHKDNFFHTLEVVDNISKVSDSLWLRWAALLHDIGKSITKKYVSPIGWTFHSHEFVGARMIITLFQRLKFPLGSTVKYVKKIVQLSSRPIALVSKEATDSAFRRLLFYAGKDIDDLMLLCKADITTKNDEKRYRYKNNFALVEKKLLNISEKDRIRNWQSPISGEEIMKIFNLRPSKKVGIIKKSIKEAVLEGHIAPDRESVYSFILKKGKELGL
ncbi:MAG: CCA tRNA nucleotidyltransferase [Candidatus Walczuchella monophlebidarum]